MADRDPACGHATNERRPSGTADRRPQKGVKGSARKTVGEAKLSTTSGCTKTSEVQRTCPPANGFAALWANRRHGPVALALPIFANLGHLRRAAQAIIAAVCVGGTVASGSDILIAWLLGAPRDLLLSLAPKSVTTPIAIGISEQINGYPALTAVLVIASGIIGAMLSGRLYDWIGIRDWEARGLATGIAAHGIGTAQLLTVNETAGAFAGLAIGLNGLFTAVALPLVMRFLYPTFLG
ncbi:MAG: LrgB family protein [Stellaceae bacterium]